MLYFFEIEAPDQPWPISKPLSHLTPITVGEAVVLIAHTSLYGGTIELYIGYDGTGTEPPNVGLVFKSGMYDTYGLGAPQYMPIIDRLDEMFTEPFLMFSDKTAFDIADDGGLADILREAVEVEC